MLIKALVWLQLMLELSRLICARTLVNERGLETSTTTNSEYAYRVRSINTNNNNNKPNSSKIKHRSRKNHNNRTASNVNGDNLETDELVVNTATGLIRGKQVLLNENYKEITADATASAKKVYRLNAWLGIPYAEKPIGDLRFKRPVPITPWRHVHNTTEWPNSCYQLPDTVINDFIGVEMWNANTNVSEDCLYLNIWTPSPRPRNSAVLVWIYGGGFYSGTSTLKIYDPRIMVAETQIIYVSIQYRVSIFGFLYMNHDDAPGNQGLLDQALALKWIHNNIQYFGGDSSKITIFGESAGSVSVSLHLLSPLSSNLFRNAIMQSGTVLADWALLEGIESIKRNSEILMSLGCNGTKAQMIECAKRVDSKTAIERSDEHFFNKATYGVAQFTFLPVVDNYFLEDEPINLLNRGKFKKCPILLGTNRDEGNWFFVYAFPEYRNLSGGPVINYELFREFITNLFYFYPQYPSTSSTAILNSVLYRYTNWNNVHNSTKNFENLDDAAGDFHFTCPVIDFANIYAMDQQQVYLYHYTQRSSRHHWPEWLGVMHGDEISFVFGEPLSAELNYTYSEKVLTRMMLKYWTNFARYSNPNGPYLENSNNFEIERDPAFNNDDYTKLVHSSQTLMQPIEYWRKYKIQVNSSDESQRAHIVLNSDKVYIDYNLRSEYCAFWGSFIPSLVLSESRCHCNGCSYSTEHVVASLTNSGHFTHLKPFEKINFITTINILVFFFFHICLFI